MFGMLVEISANGIVYIKCQPYFLVKIGKYCQILPREFGLKG